MAAYGTYLSAEEGQEHPVLSKARVPLLFLLLSTPLLPTRHLLLPASRYLMILLIVDFDPAFQIGV